MSKALAFLYATAVLALLVSATLIWRLRCESFGCMGVGVAWFAWVAAFFPILALGAWLRSSASLGAVLRTVTRSAVWVQVVLGVALVAAWVGKSAA